jgi:phospholysine phosphohistidine inorganic pyrophosphate phosphatase
MALQAILFDLDGVFYVGDRLIDGAVDTLRWCDDNAIPYLFITNTTSRPPQAIVDKLQGFGIATAVAHILSPPVAAVQWLREQGLQRVALYVAAQTRTAFAEFQLVEAEAEAVEAVVVGDLGEGWRFEVLNRAFRQLMQAPSPVLIALGMTRYWRAPDGLRLDAGPYVTALQYATGASPVVVGKPAPVFFQAALHLLGVEAGATLMIGDDIKGDIGGAQAAGIKGLLVRTGKFQPSDLKSAIKPHAVVDSIADLPTWWAAQR